MPTLWEPEGERCPRCNGAGKHPSRSGKTRVRCGRCKGNRIEFPIWRSRTWWAPFAAAGLFALLAYCGWNFGMPSWAGGMF